MPPLPSAPEPPPGGQRAQTGKPQAVGGKHALCMGSGPFWRQKLRRLLGGRRGGPGDLVTAALRAQVQADGEPPGPVSAYLRKADLGPMTHGELGHGVSHPSSPVSPVRRPEPARPPPLWRVRGRQAQTPGPRDSDPCPGRCSANIRLMKTSRVSEVCAPVSHRGPHAPAANTVHRETLHASLAAQPQDGVPPHMPPPPHDPGLAPQQDKRRRGGQGSTAE